MNIYLLIILSILALIDIKKREIHDIFYLLFLPIISIKLELFIIFFILCFIFKYLETYIGGADLKLMMIMYTILSFDNFILWLLYASVIALFFMIFVKKKDIAFFPFFALGYSLLWV